MQLILHKIVKMAPVGKWKFLIATTRDLNSHHPSAFLLGVCKDIGQVLSPYKALIIQRSSQLGGPKATAASSRKAMNDLAPWCWESTPGTTTGTNMFLMPMAHLPSSLRYQFGSRWVMCAYSLLVDLEYCFLTSIQ